MGYSSWAWLLIALALLCANLPFLGERLLLVGPRRTPKPLAWRLFELLLLALLVLGLGMVVEAHIGQRQPQGWEFYAAAGCLFVTFAFPGFVWRYLLRRR